MFHCLAGRCWHEGAAAPVALVRSGTPGESALSSNTEHDLVGPEKSVSELLTNVSVCTTASSLVCLLLLQHCNVPRS
jgi:hypothetical protein